VEVETTELVAEADVAEEVEFDLITGGPIPIMGLLTPGSGLRDT
jgi:hypothetical protein